MMAPNLPKTYKAASFKEANGPLTLEDVELKMPEDGLVLVKVLAVGVCHSDAMVQAAAMNTLYVDTTGTCSIPDLKRLDHEFQVTRSLVMWLHCPPQKRDGRLATVLEGPGMVGMMVCAALLT